MIKASKITVFVKEFSIRMKREVKEGNFHVRTTITLSFLMTFLVLILGLFVHNRVRKFLTLPTEDYSFYPQLITSQHSHFQNEIDPFLSDFLPMSVTNPREELEDWISPKKVWHKMSDSELFWRASLVPKIVEYPYNRTAKIAFMFLSKGRLPLAELWERFFKGYESFFSIYIHTSPDYAYEPPESSVFHNRRIPSQAAEWGKKTMIDAEKRLLANALLDYSNERFILLSETCIPLFNFTTIYNFLINSELSFLGCFDDPRYMGRGRYNKRMSPHVSLSDWRKGSQWFEAHRRLAVEMISDVRYYPVFVEHCKPPCYMDEHYFPTLVNIVWPQCTSNSSITWADWSRGGSHPKTFVRGEISSEFIDRIRHGFNCTYNGRITTMCFLFARKFHPNTLQSLLNIAPHLLGLN